MSDKRVSFLTGAGRGTGVDLGEQRAKDLREGAPVFRGLFTSLARGDG